MIAPIFVALAAPIALGALCGIMNERSGIVNIGIEGMMLSSAFTAFLVAALVAQAMGPIAPSPIFGATIPILVGVVAAVAMGMLVSAPPRLALDLDPGRPDHQRDDHQYPRLRPDRLPQSADHLAEPASRRRHLPALVLPGYLVDLPFVGWILKGFFAQGPITISVLFLVVVPPDLALPLALGPADPGRRGASQGGRDGRHRRHQAPLPERHPGWHLRGTGGRVSDPRAERVVPERDDRADAGFIALAAVIFGRWTPIGAFGAALLFTASEALRVAISLTPPTGELGDVLRAIPPEFYGALPYLVTLVVLVGRRRPERPAGGRRQAVRP